MNEIVRTISIVVASAGVLAMSLCGAVAINSLKNKCNTELSSLSYHTESFLKKCDSTVSNIDGAVCDVRRMVDSGEGTLNDANRALADARQAIIDLQITLDGLKRVPIIGRYIREVD